MEGKVVLITGASSGIGEAMAHSFFKQGCRIILASRRKEELSRVKNDLTQKSYGNPLAPVVLQMDVSQLESIQNKALLALEMFGGIDILVNNAGIAYLGDILNTDIEVFKKVMETNFFGSVLLTKVVASHMKEKRRGHVVFISSIVGRFSPVRICSKHALQAFADSLRSEVASHGVKVTVVSPGWTQTQLDSNTVTETGDKLERKMKCISMGLSPEHVAEKVVKAVKNEKKEVLVSHFLEGSSVYLRFLAPPLFFFVHRLCADSLRKIEDKHNKGEEGGLNVIDKLVALGSMS